jgi:hypothetical protein
MPIFPGLGRLREENGEFKASMGYTGRPCLPAMSKKLKQKTSFFPSSKDALFPSSFSVYLR